MGTCLFGEVVEPTTRALVDEDIEHYPPYIEIPHEWEGQSEVPNKIDTLIFLETDNLHKLFNSCIIHDQKPICKLNNGGINIFDVADNKFIVTYFEAKQLNTRQIVEALANWIFNAEKIYTITTDSICKYQNLNLVDKPATVIRILSNDSSKQIDYTQLESPNLVTGIGSSVLTYCIHLRMMKCTLFIAYIDTFLLDSLNSGPILELFRKINVRVLKMYTQNDISSNNLYM